MESVTDEIRKLSGKGQQLIVLEASFVEKEQRSGLAVIMKDCLHNMFLDLVNTINIKIKTAFK